MSEHRHRLYLLLLGAALLLAYLAGVATASGGRAVPVISAVPFGRIPSQWAAVQASNSLLAGGPTYCVSLPLVTRGQ